MIETAVAWTTRLLIEANTKKNIKVPPHLPFGRGIHGSPVDCPYGEPARYAELIAATS